jgi:proton-dependent oligopeptide transporter, POT family
MADPSPPGAADSRMRAELAQYDRAFFGHPRGLSTLFFTEMWERFSYYGMRALLLLFMTAPAASGGLGFDTATGGAIYGLYTSMVYMATLPGGWIADRLIGQRKAVLYGGVFIACGHFSMAISSLTTFYLGLFLIVIGTGLLKGNVSVIVGYLYGPNDRRRDAGFSIFYMGINLGAFVAPLVCGYLGQKINWHVGFVSAGVGMVIGLIQYVLGGRYLGDAGRYPAPAVSPDAARQLRERTMVLGGLALAAIIAFGVASYTGALAITAKQVSDAAGYFLLIATIAFFGWLFLGSGWTPEERKRLYAIGLLFLAAAVFWSLFEQAGSTLNLFADRDTRTTFLGWSYPSSWFQSVNSLFVWTLAPVFAWLWIKLGPLEPSTPVKFSLGLLLVGAGFAVLVVAAQLAQNGVQVSPMWLIVTYLLHTCGELCLSPVGLSAMTRLAPVRIAGLMMGVWFLATSVGNFIAGRVSGFYESMPLPGLFMAVAIFGLVAGIVMLFFAKPIRKMMGEVN